MRRMIPCSAAFAAMGVPARRWTTRADLLKQVQKGRSYLDAAPLDEVCVTGAVEAAEMSRHHFLRLFREVHGVTPHRYLTRRKVEGAKRMLRDTELCAGEIAIELGFKSPSAFSRLFRAHEKVPPMVFRMMSRAEPT